MPVKDISRKELLDKINQVKAKIKIDPVVIEMFDKNGIDIDELDTIPMKFSDLDVSARTESGIITFNLALLDDGDFEKDDHYVVHETLHYLQQSQKPTQSSDEGSYLDNKSEKDAFKVQTKYLSETRSDEEAEEYVDQVLDHHDVTSEKERNKRKKQLLELAE